MYKSTRLFHPFGVLCPDQWPGYNNAIPSGFDERLIGQFACSQWEITYPISGCKNPKG